MSLGDGWNGAGPGRAAVDSLRPEFESVDAFFQALLGVRAVCAEMDRSLDSLLGLEGVAQKWAQDGEVPVLGAGPSDTGTRGGSEVAAAAATPLDADDRLAVLLGLIALRREVERSFRLLQDDVELPQDDLAAVGASGQSPGTKSVAGAEPRLGLLR